MLLCLLIRSKNYKNFGINVRESGSSGDFKATGRNVGVDMRISLDAEREKRAGIVCRGNVRSLSGNERRGETLKSLDPMARLFGVSAQSDNFVSLEKQSVEYENEFNVYCWARLEACFCRCRPRAVGSERLS